MAIDQAQALVNAAGGDFNLTLIAIFVLFLMAVTLYIIRWATTMIPDQMQRDREATTIQMEKNNTAILSQMSQDRNAMCEKLSELIYEMRDNKGNTQTYLEKHDMQAKDILNNTLAMKTNLEARPCIKK